MNPMKRNPVHPIPSLTPGLALAAALLAAPGASLPAAPLKTAADLQDAFSEVAARSKPAVVNLSIIQETRVRLQTPYFFGDPEDFFQPFMQDGRPRTHRHRSKGTGSGFIIDPKGLVLTNDHVIRGATDIRITLAKPDGKEKSYKGKVLGRDPNMDLAVVEILSGEAFPFLKLASSPPRVGDWSIAIGSPFSLEQTVTVGVVSAERQSLYIEGRRYPDMIQTDAAINQGNSGGPLLNLQGEVMGVNTAIFSPSGASAGIGFAISAREARRALAYLLGGKKRGWIGVEASPVDEVVQARFALPSPQGALVNKVLPGGPAEKAGLKRGDVIREIDGAPIETVQALIAAASELEPGKTAAVRLYRRGSPMRLRLTPSRRPEWADAKDPRGQGPAEEEGLPAPAPESEDGAQNVLRWEGIAFSQRQEGVLVEAISPDSILHGYLLPGDIIRGVNEIEVGSLRDLDRALAKLDVPRGMFLDILRQGQALYLSIKP